MCVKDYIKKEIASDTQNTPSFAQSNATFDDMDKFVCLQVNQKSHPYSKINIQSSSVNAPATILAPIKYQRYIQRELILASY